MKSLCGRFVFVTLFFVINIYPAELQTDLKYSRLKRKHFKSILKSIITKKQEIKLKYCQANCNDTSIPYYLKPVKVRNIIINIKVNESCEPFQSITPNYSDPSLRISEKKCLEYIAKVDNHIREEEWIERCDRIKRKSGEVGLENTFAISGDEAAFIYDFPHMGAIGWKALDPTVKWVFKCSSTLISEKFLLTAAHCTKLSLTSGVIRIQPEIVRLGDINISNDEFRVKQRFIDMTISRIIRHHRYADPRMYYDIALIKLHQEVKFTKSLHPACLWSEHDFSQLGNKAMFTGWGYTKHGHRSDILQVAIVSLLETSVCEQIFKTLHSRNWQGFQNHQICAEELGCGVDNCQGDSGGPIQIKMPLERSQGNTYWILGVTSFYFRSRYTNRPGIYTRVSSFTKWIEEVVWEQI